MLHATGQVLNNRYRIVKLLGQGGFGAVYRVWDMHLNVSCALKQNRETTRQSARQFAREANILAKLRHPNLPKVTDHFTLPGQGQYLVMEYIDGEDLAAKQEKADGPLPEARVLAWADQILDALEYLHSQEPPIIHRDIKPANIRITPQGQAVLVDFGIAKINDPDTTTTEGARAVTPGYSPYEQYSLGTTDARTDIYALGATLYTLLTGQVIHESVLRAIDDPVKPPDQLNPSLSPATSLAILRAIQIDPRRRWQTAVDFKAALRDPNYSDAQSAGESNEMLAEPIPGMSTGGFGSPPMVALPGANEQATHPGNFGAFAILGITALILILVIGGLSGLYFLDPFGWLPGDSPVRGILTSSVLATRTAVMSPSNTSISSGATVDTLPAGSGQTGEKLRIGLLAPLSGAVPSFGLSTKEGADLAVKEWNARGGVLGKNVEVVMLDSQCEAGPAVDATEQLIHQEGIRYIIGEVCSRASIPVSEIADQNHVLMISPVSTNPAVTVDASGRTRPFVFRACFIDPFQGEVMARFAQSQGYQTAFVIYQPGNEYSASLGESFATVFTSLGGQIVGKESYLASTTDFSMLLDKVIASQAEVLFVPDYYPIANMVGKQAQAMGVRAVLMGGDGWDSPGLDLSALDGGYFTNHFDPGDTRSIMVKWLRRFGDEYNIKMPDAVAALTYDATDMLLAMIAEVGVDDPAQVAEALAGATWEGVTGTFYFDAQHNPVKSATVLGIREGKRFYVATVEP